VSRRAKASCRSFSRSVDSARTRARDVDDGAADQRGRHLDGALVHFQVDELGHPGATARTTYGLRPPPSRARAPDRGMDELEKRAAHNSTARSRPSRPPGVHPDKCVPPRARQARETVNRAQGKVFGKHRASTRRYRQNTGGYNGLHPTAGLLGCGSARLLLHRSTVPSATSRGHVGTSYVVAEEGAHCRSLQARRWLKSRCSPPVFDGIVSSRLDASRTPSPCARSLSRGPVRALGGTHVWVNGPGGRDGRRAAEELVGVVSRVHPSPDLALARAKAEGGAPYVVRAVRRDGQPSTGSAQRPVEMDGPAADQRRRHRRHRARARRIDGAREAPARAFHDVLHACRTARSSRPPRAPPRAGEAAAPDSFSVLVLDIDRFKVINDASATCAATSCWSKWRAACSPACGPPHRRAPERRRIHHPAEDVASVGDARRVADRLREELRVPFWLGAHEVSAERPSASARQRRLRRIPRHHCATRHRALPRPRRKDEAAASSSMPACTIARSSSWSSRLPCGAPWNAGVPPPTSRGVALHRQITAPEAWCGWKHPERVWCRRWSSSRSRKRRD